MPIQGEGVIPDEGFARGIGAGELFDGDRRVLSKNTLVLTEVVIWNSGNQGRALGD